MNNAFFVFCTGTTKMYADLAAALAAAWLESCNNHNIAVPVYTAARDGSLSHVAATVTANA